MVINQNLQVNETGFLTLTAGYGFVEEIQNHRRKDPSSVISLFADYQKLKKIFGPRRTQICYKMVLLVDSNPTWSNYMTLKFEYSKNWPMGALDLH